MADEVEWLPPAAPGAQPPQRWESRDDDPAPAAQEPIASQTWSEPSFAQPQTVPQSAAPWQSGAIAQRQGNGLAVTALVLGIAGLAIFVGFGFGLLFFLNLPCSVLAWVLGVQAKRRVDRGETTERRGMAQAAQWLGIAGVAIGVLGLIGWAIGFALSDDLRDEFRREWERQRR